MTHRPIIECEQVHKSLGGQKVLSGLDLTVEAGRVYVLLGRNGAGKSTTFKLLLGLMEVDAGRVRLFQEPWRRSILDRVGASVNGPALYGQLSAYENLLVHARLVGLARARIVAVLDEVGLGGTGRKKVRTFSTGMRARLALGIALLADPQVLLLDEPQNGLDPEGIVELRYLIKRLAAQGRTILISSHQLGEVQHLADDIGVLAGGRLVYQGPLAGFAAEGTLEDSYFRATVQTGDETIVAVDGRGVTP